jgi:3-oxoacyl-[acyl-carrier protein] reductase
MLLKDRVAIVTGGNTGIGRAIVEAYVTEGAKVAIGYITKDEEAQALVAKIQGQGGQALAIRCDVSEEAQVQSMVEQVMGEYGQIDILVNMAGIWSSNTIADMTVQEWDRMMAVHLRGHFLCSHFVLPHMIKRGYGKIINTASQLGQIGQANTVHYCAAKAGVIGFTKSLAREVGPLGIYVNAIAPGPIATDLVPQKLDGGANRKRLIESLPLRRIGSVEDVAPTAVFLASDQSNYYAGQTLGPNGGDVML